MLTASPDGGSLWFRAIDGRQIEVRAEVHSMGNAVIIAGYRFDSWTARQLAQAVHGLGQVVAR